MQTFNQFLSEQAHSTVHYFDVDKTLMHTDTTKVHVKDENGKHVESLDPQQFDHHQLKPGHSYDFSEFRSAERFKTARPIGKMMKKMTELHKRGKKVEILTARSDFDDKKKFAQKWKQHGVDISKGNIHVRRAGNIKLPTHEAKAKIISDGIKKYGHKVVHLYDDHLPNIQAALDLKKQHPDVTFHGHHIQHGENGSITVTHYKA